MRNRDRIPPIDLQAEDVEHRYTGHPYDEANTYHGKNGRQCRTCKRDGHRIQRAARKVAGG